MNKDCNRIRIKLLYFSVLFLIIFANFLPAISAESYNYTTNGKYINYEVNYSIVIFNVNFNQKPPSRDWVNYSLNLSVDSILYGNDYIKMNISTSADMYNINSSVLTPPKYYIINISNNENSLYASLTTFLYPLAYFSAISQNTNHNPWLQVNNTTLSKLNNNSFGKVKLLSTVPFGNISTSHNGIEYGINVTTPVREIGKTSFKMGNDYVSADKLEIVQNFQKGYNYSNQSSFVLVDSNSGVAVYGSQRDKVFTAIPPYVNQNGQVLGLLEYYNYSMKLARTNFPLALVPSFPWIYILIVAVAVFVVISIFIYKRRQASR